MERAIDPYAPDLGQANHILQDPISRAQRRPREWAPTKRRGWPPVTPVVPEEGTYYTHVGSSHLASISHSVGTEGAGTSETGGWSPFIQSSTYEANTSEGGAWPQWVNLPTYAAAGTSEAGYTVRLGDDEARDDEGPSQDHLAKSYVYRPDMSFLEDQHHTPPPFTQVPSFGSPTYRFGRYSSPWAYATVRPPRAAAHPSEVEEVSEPEEPSEHEQRLQPPRAAKGKGRRCHTGSHFFGHKKK
ncbi:hypothetical protein ACET3Z_025224 [Daucus carota]